MEEELESLISFKDFKIGEKFNHNGKCYICLEVPLEEGCIISPCDELNCAFLDEDCDFLACMSDKRKDGKEVYFKEVKEQ